MPGATGLYCKAPTAADFLSAMDKVLGNLFANDHVELQVQTNVEGLAVHINAPAGVITKQPQFTDFLNLVATRPEILIRTSRIAQHPNHHLVIRYVTDDGIIGRFELERAPDVARAGQAVDTIASAFRITPYVDLVGRAAGGTEQAALQLRERSVADLRTELDRQSDFLKSLMEQETEFRHRLMSDLEAGYRDRQTELERSFQQRQEKLDEAHVERQRNLDQRRAEQDAETDAKLKAISDREQRFETRESKYVRRELLQKINAALADAETTVLSKPTSQKRGAVHWSCVALCGICLSIAGPMVYRLLTDQQPDWHHLVPLSASFLTLVGTMVYYLKWNDRWFREHADLEFQAKRFKADILRASWVAELVAERAKDGHGELAPELLSAFTRGLFSEGSRSRVTEHPMDDLTSIIKRATELELGKGWFKVKGPNKPAAGPRH